MFWKRCVVSVKGATPTHCAPSAPMWVTPMMPRSMPMAMPWQPMPAEATLPSGTTVERLCGQPEQKKALRARVNGFGRRFSSSRCWMRASTESMRMRRASRRAIARATRSESSSPTGCSSGRSSSSNLPTTCGRSVMPYRMSLQNISRNDRFSSMTRISCRPRENSRTTRGSIGNSMPILRIRMP